MKCLLLLIPVFLGFAMTIPFDSLAADQRAVIMAAEANKAKLLEKAKRETLKAKAEAISAQKRILSDKNALKTATSRMLSENNRIKAQIIKMENQIAALRLKEKTYRDTIADQRSDMRELVGVIRANVKDLKLEISMSPQTAFLPDRTKGFQNIINQTVFPDMGDIDQIRAVLFDEIARSGEVRIEKADFVNREGTESHGDVLILGNFTAAYQLGNETGLLIYSDKSRRFFALSKLPPLRMAKAINRYMAGESESVPIDISKGGALRQLTYRMSLWDRIRKGGPIVWPILIIGAIGILIVLERVGYLIRKRVKSEAFMGEICQYAEGKKWDICQRLCEEKKKRSLPKVLLAGIHCKDMNREDLENSLQEAILGEIPKMERFLSTLGMLAAISPLLGLLGTVTGMINTFHIITLYGTGDPRLMSGGISEALVTTMLGLTVAIPLMMAHTLISRRVETNISEIEEKAVAFVNMVFKTRQTK